MNTDTATIAALVVAYRHHYALVRDGDPCGRWLGPVGEADQIGSTFGAGPEALMRAIALSEDTGAPIDLLVAAVDRTATWNRIAALLVRQGMEWAGAREVTYELVK